MCLLLNWLEGVDPSRLLKKSIRSLFDSDHPWSSPYGRYQVAPNFSPGEIVNTQSKKRPLLRLPALGRALRPASRGITTSL